MADVVIMGAGLGGALMACEMKAQMRREDRLTVVTKDPLYHFVPSNPWVPVGWRKREALQVDLTQAFAKRDIRFKPTPVTKLSPKDNLIETADYIGHLGLDGVGDTKGLLEGEMRDHHIKWMTSARIKKVEQGKMTVEEVGDDGAVRSTKELPFGFSMILQAFRGISPLRGIEGLVNPRGFVIVYKHQRNPAFPDIFSVGVCVAIPPVGPTPVPCGVPKTGFMIESMVTATARNVCAILRGEKPRFEATWNAVCLADFGDSGVAFVAQPQIPPRNVNWSSSGKWVHAAKIGFEKYFLRKMRKGESEPFYESMALNLLGIEKLKAVKSDSVAAQ